MQQPQQLNATGPRETAAAAAAKAVGGAAASTTHSVTTVVTKGTLSCSVLFSFFVSCLTELRVLYLPLSTQLHGIVRSVDRPNPDLFKHD